MHFKDSVKRILAHPLDYRGIDIKEQQRLYIAIYNFCIVNKTASSSRGGGLISNFVYIALISNNRRIADLIREKLYKRLKKPLKMYV